MMMMVLKSHHNDEMIRMKMRVQAWEKLSFAKFKKDSSQCSDKHTMTRCYALHCSDHRACSLRRARSKRDQTHDLLYCDELALALSRRHCVCTNFMKK